MKKYLIHPTNVRICGRTICADGGVFLGYSASFIEFTGVLSDVQVQIIGVHESPEYDYAAYVGVFVNDEQRPRTVIPIKNGNHTYQIYSAPMAEQICLRLVKLTESQYNKLCVLAIYADGAIEPTAPRQRKLLFIGDSITAGYGVTGDARSTVFDTKEEDATLAYPYLVSQRLHADSHIVCWGGNGLVSRWLAPGQTQALKDHLMPLIFPYAEYSVQELLGTSAKQLVNPDDFMPQAAVINLGSNDSTYTQQIPEREAEFCDCYIQFIKSVLDIYPNIKILLAYGVMDDAAERTLFDAVQRVAEECRMQGMPVSFCALPAQIAADGIGAAGHPSQRTHVKLANTIAGALCRVMHWEE